MKLNGLLQQRGECMNPRTSLKYKSYKGKTQVSMNHLPERTVKELRYRLFYREYVSNQPVPNPTILMQLTIVGFVTSRRISCPRSFAKSSTMKCIVYIITYQSKASLIHSSRDVIARHENEASNAKNQNKPFFQREIT